MDENKKSGQTIWLKVKCTDCKNMFQLFYETDVEINPALFISNEYGKIYSCPYCHEKKRLGDFASADEIPPWTVQRLKGEIYE